MRRLYHPYWDWEDYKNGMFELREQNTESEDEQLAGEAKELLSDSTEFYNIGLQMVKQWKKSAEQNLSNINRNRQAWIGQASCSYKLGIPERITKLGWRLMTPDQQKEANNIADKIIGIWELENAEKNTKQKCL